MVVEEYTPKEENHSGLTGILRVCQAPIATDNPISFSYKATVSNTAGGEEEQRFTLVSGDTQTIVGPSGWSWRIEPENIPQGYQIVSPQPAIQSGIFEKGSFQELAYKCELASNGKTKSKLPFIVAGIVAIVVIIALMIVLLGNSSSSSELDTFSSNDGTISVSIPQDMVYSHTEEGDYVYICGGTEDTIKAHLHINKSVYGPTKYTKDDVTKSLYNYYKESKSSASYVSKDLSYSSTKYDFEGVLLSYVEYSNTEYALLYVTEYNGAFWEVQVDYDNKSNKGFAEDFAKQAMDTLEINYSSKPSNSEDSKTSIFNIAAGLGTIKEGSNCYLANDYFKILMPDENLWCYATLNGNLHIYHRASKEAGYNGSLVTIKAYDISDNSYTNLPKYTIAGTSTDKRYIAIFPTDVQYGDDQADEYRSLENYFLGMDSVNNASKNPFSVK